MSPWVRIDENAMDHPKFLALTDGAWRLWCEGQAYCQKHLTNGRIPKAALRGFRYFSTSRVKNLTTEFVPMKGPCWHTEPDGTVQVHDYLEWNDSRDEVLKARSDSRDRRRRWNERERVPGRRRNASSDASPDGDETAYVSSGVCVESREGSSIDSEKIFPRTRGVGSGVMAGSLPRDHLRHAFCGRVCVPEFLHGEFCRKIGGDEAISDQTAHGFYAQVLASIPNDRPIGDDPIKFWRAQFAAVFGSVVVSGGKTAGNAAALARFVARGGTS